jgi:adenine nucleotide transporter 17
VPLRVRLTGRTPEQEVDISTGAVTSTIVNPLWVIQATQATYTMQETSADGSRIKKRAPSMFQTVDRLFKEGGLSAFWRGIGPALLLVMNPVIQYTVFEQLKNLLVNKRTETLRLAEGVSKAVLSDWDFFLLGALSKLRMLSWSLFR